MNKQININLNKIIITPKISHTLYSKLTCTVHTSALKFLCRIKHNCIHHQKGIPPQHTTYNNNNNNEQPPPPLNNYRE